MGAAARQECPEGQGRALDEEERCELLRLQEPPRRGQGAQADPQMGCDGRGRALQPEAGRCARSLQHWQGGLGGQRLPLGADRGRPESEGLAEPYPPARRTRSTAVRAPEVGEHDALEGTRPCRARIRPAAELDGRQDRAHHRHRAGEVQDRDDEPRLQHPSAGSARADGACARLSALTGGVRVSCKRPARRQSGPRSGAHLGTSAATARSAKAAYCSRSPPINLGQLIAAIRGVPDPGIAPDLAATMPLFKGTVPQVATFAPKDLIVRYGVAMVGVLVSVVLFRLQQPAPLLGLLTLAGSAFLAARESKSAEAAKKAVSQTAAAWTNVETQWNRVKENREFLELRRQADHLITQTQTLGGEESRLLAGLKAKQKEAQLTQFLQQFYIAQAKIKGIGRNRKIVLRSYGIETAADVAQNRIQQISGFGPVVEGTLIAWRKSIEKRFVFNPNQPISPADIAAIKAAVLKKKYQLESDLRQSLAGLQNASNGTRSIRNSLKASAVQIWNAQKQAQLTPIIRGMWR